MNLKQQLIEMNACEEAVEWVGRKQLKTAWDVRSCGIDTCDPALRPRKDVQAVQPPLEISMTSPSMDAHEENEPLWIFISVQGATELHGLDSLVFLLVELLLPAWLISVHSLVQLLEDAEICTRRRSNQECGASSLILLHA